MIIVTRPISAHSALSPNDIFYFYFQQYYRVVCNLQFTAHKKVIKAFHNWARFSLNSVSIFLKEKFLFLSLSTFHTFAMSQRNKSLQKKKKKNALLRAIFCIARLGLQTFTCDHNIQDQPLRTVGRIHLYITPRDGHSRVTFLRSCGRLQAIALRRPHAVNHVIFGCYSRTYHSALQFRPVWWALFLMLFGFMCSICQKIPFR